MVGGSGGDLVGGWKEIWLFSACVEVFIFDNFIVFGVVFFFGLEMLFRWGVRSYFKIKYG